MQREKLERAFEKNFREQRECGASVSVWQGGKEIVSCAGGWVDYAESAPWTEHTLVPFFSTTKALSAATVLWVLEQHHCPLNTPVRACWEGFGVEGSIAELMSHQLGLSALDNREVSIEDFDAVIHAIESQSPNWALGKGLHGYHPRVYGFLLDKLVRIFAKKSLAEVWQEEIASPNGLELWLTLPQAHFSRVATLYPGKANKGELQTPFYQQLNTKGSLTHRAFTSPRGLFSIREMNEPRAWQSGLPAMSGIGNARSLAKFYQMVCGQIPFFSENVRRAMATRLVDGMDCVLKIPTAFSCGFQFDPRDSFGRKLRHHYGMGHEAFGHPGAGGSHAFCDPSRGLSFSYVMNQMDLSVLPSDKCQSLVDCLIDY